MRQSVIYKRNLLFFTLLSLEMDNEKRVYNRLKIVLAIKRMKNIELAGLLGISVQTVSKWVTNTHQPSIQELYRIAEVLNVELMDLLEPLERK